MAVYQIFVKLLDGRTRCLQIPSPTVSGEALKRALFGRTRIPLQFQRLVSGFREIRDGTLISASEDGFFPSCSLLLRLPGGKGGFGSLLRGAATKAGQKKTSNFDACRDMSGRRLRHVNAEKKLEEWKAEAGERKLEKLAEQFLRKKSKEVRKGPSAAVEKYIEKYKEDSQKCMEEVEESVRQSFALYEKSKRKILPSSGPGSKRLKVWLGKEKAVESDSEDDEEDGADEKSVVLDDRYQNDAEGSSGSISGGHSDAESSGGGSGQSKFEEENVYSDQGCLDLGEGSGSGDDSAEPETTVHEEVPTDSLVVSSSEKLLDSNDVTSEEEGSAADLKVSIHEEMDAENMMVSCPEKQMESNEVNLEMETLAKPNLTVHEETVPQSSGIANIEEPLNFDNFTLAAEMELLGMERLKTELQARGLKCGGTLQERAARLFLLKTTPVDKLPKKSLAKPTAGRK